MIKHIDRVTTLNATDIINTARKVREVCKEMNELETIIMPYNFKMTVRELLDGIDENVRYCTYCSRQVYRAELNGFIDILNCWIDTYNEPKVEVEYVCGRKEGTRKYLAYSVAEDLEYVGLVKRV